MTPAHDDRRKGDRYFAFVRAINTGGRRLTNEELVAPFVGLGFEDVAAYQAAGNITFRSRGPHPVDADDIEPALAEAYGFPAPVFIRSWRSLSAIGEAQPFSEDELAATDGRLQVTFMRSAPDDETIAELLALVPERDRVVFSNREWFWLPTRGVSDSELPVGKIEALVGPMTMRTLGTIVRMLARFD